MTRSLAELIHNDECDTPSQDDERDFWTWIQAQLDSDTTNKENSLEPI